jgi:hypothetical protein
MEGMIAFLMAFREDMKKDPAVSRNNLRADGSGTVKKRA